MEESIYVKFNDKKPDKDLLELDESFTDLNINDRDEGHQLTTRKHWTMKKKEKMKQCSTKLALQNLSSIKLNHW